MGIAVAFFSSSLELNWIFQFICRTSEAQKPVDPQIHYEPDSDDDFDYEDPDEDLYIWIVPLNQNKIHFNWSQSEWKFIPANAHRRNEIFMHATREFYFQHVMSCTNVRYVKEKRTEIKKKKKKKKW